jgi:hypothetical protein
VGEEDVGRIDGGHKLRREKLKDEKLVKVGV